MDENIEKRLTDIEANQKEIFSRLNAVELSDGVITEKLDNIKESQKEVKQSLRDLQDTISKLIKKPGERWDSIVTSIIVGVIMLIAGYLFAKLTGK
jgi:septal ring factor EnvC (AmiA/AmiB activator)